MKAFNTVDLMREYAINANKWCMYLSHSCNCYSELYKAAPYLKDLDNLLMNDSIIFIFDSKEEMEVYYNQTVGDDGPTKSNQYSGPCRVYALTCSSDGVLLTENT